MLQRIILLLLFISCLIHTSCRSDFEFQPSTGNLTFSKDTVYLDTVFTNIGSSTYNLKVYNKSNKDVYIPSIQLTGGENSLYRLNVDGMTGKSFNNVELLAKDSLFIFIETTIDIQQIAANQNQFLYTDVLEFNHASSQQTIPLVSLVKDAIFLYPQQLANGTKETIMLDDGETEIEGFYLDDDELTFTNQKPYVIYGYAAVNNGKTLTVEAGARVHFHKDSGILVANGGNIQVLGELSTDQQLLENEVIFEGDRLEPTYENTPGQWGTIWFSKESVNNYFNYATIKNATVGLLVEGLINSSSPTLTIENTQIYNSASVGLWGQTAHIQANNLVVGNSGQVSLYCSLGGYYSFTHCTIANYSNGFRNTPALLVDNYITLEDGSALAAPLAAANFTNCIIDGNTSIEFFLDAIENVDFNYAFTNNSIKFEDTFNEYSSNPLFNFDDITRYQNNIFNEDAHFLNTAQNKFQIGELSAGINNADGNASQLVPLDILGINRTSAPDMGAYQHIQFN